MPIGRFSASELDAFLALNPNPAGPVAPVAHGNATIVAAEEYARVGDRLCPKRIELTLDGDSSSPTVSARVEVIDGVPNVVSLAFVKRTAAQREVRQTDLRDVEISSLIDLLAGFSVRLVRNDQGEVEVVRGDAELSNAVFGLAKQRRNRRMTREFLAEVAEVYRQNVEGAPNQAIRERWLVKERTASKWIQEARAVGELPKTTRGRKKA